MKPPAGSGDVVAMCVDCMLALPDGCATIHCIRLVVLLPVYWCDNGAFHSANGIGCCGLAEGVLVDSELSDGNVRTFKQRSIWQFILIVVLPALLILWAVLMPWLRRNF